MSGLACVEIKNLNYRGMYGFVCVPRNFYRREGVLNVKMNPTSSEWSILFRLLYRRRFEFCKCVTFKLVNMEGGAIEKSQ